MSIRSINLALTYFDRRLALDSWQNLLRQYLNTPRRNLDEAENELHTMVGNPSSARCFNELRLA